MSLSKPVPPDTVLVDRAAFSLRQAQSDFELLQRSIAYSLQLALSASRSAGRSAGDAVRQASGDKPAEKVRVGRKKVVERKKSVEEPLILSRSVYPPLGGKQTGKESVVHRVTGFNAVVKEVPAVRGATEEVVFSSLRSRGAGGIAIGRSENNRPGAPVDDDLRAKDVRVPAGFLFASENASSAASADEGAPPAGSIASAASMVETLQHATSDLLDELIDQASADLGLLRHSILHTLGVGPPSAAFLFAGEPSASAGEGPPEQESFEQAELRSAASWAEIRSQSAASDAGWDAHVDVVSNFVDGAVDDGHDDHLASQNVPVQERRARGGAGSSWRRENADGPLGSLPRGDHDERGEGQGEAELEDAYAGVLGRGGGRDVDDEGILRESEEEHVGGASSKEEKQKLAAVVEPAVSTFSPKVIFVPSSRIFPCIPRRISDASLAYF